MSSLSDTTVSISKQLLECIICTCPFVQPVMVKECGHSFCEQCLLQSLNQKLQCPQCRKKLKLDNNNNRTILPYQINYGLKSVVESIYPYDGKDEKEIQTLIQNLTKNENKNGEGQQRAVLVAEQNVAILHDDICIICRREFMDICIACEMDMNQFESCPIIVGRCSHKYHSHCIVRWLTSNITCPLDDEPWITAQTVPRN